MKTGYMWYLKYGCLGYISVDETIFPTLAACRQDVERYGIAEWFVGIQEVTEDGGVVEPIRTIQLAADTYWEHERLI